jgi:tetratricopeptide (TPR) repeat protein
MRTFSFKLSPVLLAVAAAFLLFTRPAITSAHVVSPAVPPTFEPAAFGELLVVVADFQPTASNLPNPAEAFYTALTGEFTGTTLPLRIEHIPTVIADQAQAKALSDAVNATLVIWGQVSDSSLNTCFQIDPRSDALIEPVQTTCYAGVTSPETLQSWIESAVDPTYMVNFIAGQIMYRREHDKQTALALFERAVVLASPLTEARRQEMNVELAYFYVGLMSNDAQRKLDAYGAALELNPTSDWYDAALGNYMGALSQDTNTRGSLTNAGLSDTLTGKHGRAVFELDAALSLNPDHSYTMLVLGAALESVGNAVKSADIYTRYTGQIGRDTVSEPVLALNTPRTIEMSAGRIVYIPFEGFAGQTVSLHGDSTAVDALIVLLDPLNQPLAGNDDIVLTRNLNAQIADFVLPATGRYTLMVTHSNNRTQGSVIVTIKTS